MDRVAEDLRFALILKFVLAKPSIVVLRKQFIKTWGFVEVPMISFINNYHVLIHLTNENDYFHA